MSNNLLTEALRRMKFARDVRNRQKIRSAVERYLDSRQYTLFSDWDISKPDGKAMAADWLTDQVIQVLDEIGEKP